MDYQLNVQGMSCGHCVRAITQALQQQDARAKVSVDLATAGVHVSTELARETIVTAIVEAGYVVND